jgi:hypothetical protein
MVEPVAAVLIVPKAHRVLSPVLSSCEPGPQGRVDPLGSLSAHVPGGTVGEYRLFEWQQRSLGAVRAPGERIGSEEGRA